MPFPFMAFGTGVLGVLGVLWWLGGWVVGWLAFGTGEGLLWYRICVPCSKRLPPVRDAFSEDIRCKKQAFPVQDGYSVPETPFSGTGQARCPENSLVMHGAQFIKRRSVQGRASFFTE